jgi:hypothetical protein
MPCGAELRAVHGARLKEQLSMKEKWLAANVERWKGTAVLAALSISQNIQTKIGSGKRTCEERWHEKCASYKEGDFVCDVLGYAF